MKQVSELLELLRLEQIEENIFRGQSHSIGSRRVFGGQVLAQALQSAIHTVPANRYVHSLHAYFILPGDVEHPIVFEVDRIRDGGSFTTRRVKAIQKGQAIFNLSASFQLAQDGFDHLTVGRRSADVPGELPLVDAEMREPMPHTRYYPLANWSDAHIGAYLTKHSVPLPSLYDEGYEHTDCEPCVRKGEEGDDWSGASPEQRQQLQELRDMGYM